jgi:hypothetical protein
VRQDRTKIKEHGRDSDDTSNEAIFALIHTDRRHARIFTLSRWKRRPRDVIILERTWRAAALAFGAPASTMVVPLLVPSVTVSISAVSILILILTLALALYIPSVAIAIPLTVTTVTVLLTVAVAVSVSIPIAVSLTATAATRATGAVSAWWRRTPINSPHG